MLYTERNKLTVIELAEMKDTLAFHELEDILWERPASTVYIEVAGLLYGVVSIGDINRSYEGGKDCVNINKKFIFIQPGQSMLARQIFKERERICAIPVVNTAGKIIGDYTRWNDLMYLDCKNFFHNKHVKLFLKENRHMALVKPNDIFPEKRRLLLEWKSMLEEQGVVVDIIDRKQIYEYFDKVDRILFTDEHELRGTHCVYTSVLQKAFDRCKAVTYKEFIYAFNQIVINDFLSMIQKQGVHLLTYSYEENENGYKEKLEQKIGENFNVLGLKRTKRILSKMKKGFLEEIYNEEYEKSFMPFPFSVTIENSIPKLKDMEEPLTHVKNGERVTIGQPADYDRCIYFYGACDVFGWWVEDKHTMESWLQDKLNQMGFACKVINCGVFLQDIYTEIDRVETTPLKKVILLLWQIINMWQ